MTFDQAYEAFMAKQKKSAKGERLKKLEEHGHLEKMLLEKVLWPVLKTFDNLHPEYEMIDFKDGDRFLDYALIIGFIRICIEADGFGPHLKNMTRWQFSDERNRQNDLVIDGWLVIRFTHDDILNSPRKCQMKLQQLLGKLMIDHNSTGNSVFSFLERAIIRYSASAAGKQIVPGEVETYLGLGKYKVKELLKSLVGKGALEAVGNGERVRKYRLVIQDIRPFLT